MQRDATIEKQPYPLRWFFGGYSIKSDENNEKNKALVVRAAKCGYTGFVLSAGLDRMSLFNRASLNRLKELSELCKANNIDLIPLIFSVGYGTSTTKHDRNLAEGFPVRDSLYVVKDDVAKHAPAPDLRIPNGGFENFTDNVAAKFDLQDMPGEVSFMDTEVFRGGKASLRFQDIPKDVAGRGRVMKVLKVKPYHMYKVSAWFKTEGLKCKDLTFYPLGDSDERYLAWMANSHDGTSDWFKREIAFNSWGYDRVRVYAGCWGGKEGKFWMDDLHIEEAGMANILRRPGAPLVVKNKATGEIYVEGEDFAPVSDPMMNYRFDHEEVDIKITPGSRIKDGDELLVSYYVYHYVTSKESQHVICMSEEKTYDIWADQIRRLHALVAPRYYFFDMDEIRAGGTCATCYTLKKKNGWDMAQILGNCVTRAHGMVKAANPKAEVVVWSDMFDPRHNAKEKGNYYLVEGSFYGSWEHIPGDIVICCWSGGHEHFSKLGFRMIFSSSYDGAATVPGPNHPKMLDKYPGSSVGVMYTTWRNDYKLLEAYGGLFLNHKTYAPKAAKDSE